MLFRNNFRDTECETGNILLENFFATLILGSFLLLTFLLLKILYPNTTLMSKSQHMTYIELFILKVNVFGSSTWPSSESQSNDSTSAC